MKFRHMFPRAALALAGLCGVFSVANAATPQYILALDGDAAWSGRDGASVKPAVVHGAAKWVDGVSGKALKQPQ